MCCMAKNLSAGRAGDMFFQKTHRKAGRSIRIMKCIASLRNEQGKNWNLKNVRGKNVRIVRDLGSQSGIEEFSNNE